MSASKPVTSKARKSKPYNPPTLTKLIPEEAKETLEARSNPADENTKRLLNEINRRLEGK